MSYVMGIDVGTGGARVLIVDEEGRVAAEARVPFATRRESLPPGWAEQDPAQWWTAAAQAVRAALERFPGSPDDIAAAACDSTSGTLAFLDAADRPLGPALMYNDVRAAAEAEEVNAAAAAHCERFGYRFSASWALPKILWVKRRRPNRWARTYRIAHATDYVTGRLCGDFGVSDTSSALKTGCDLERAEWPAFIEEELGVPLSLLPRLAWPGEEIGRISDACARETGLKPTTRVHAGATDGTAALFASGAARVGDFCSTIGTTLVLKGVARELVRDPLGRLYCHRHPAGDWLPGGASSTGGECLSAQFDPAELPALDAAALDRSPTRLTHYPLVRRGERMPFSNPKAEGFLIGEPADQAERFASCLEGVACVERLCYDLLASLGAPAGEELFTTGGGAKSDAWLQIRADVLQRSLALARSAEAAFGACLLAAAGSLHPDLKAAVKAMVSIERRVAPRPDARDAYEELFQRFVAALTERGYIER